jgi:glutamate racemase
VAGEGVRLVDSALTTAELAAPRLHELGLARRGAGPAHYRFVVTDVPLRFQTIGERFLGRSLGRVERLEW